MGQKLVAILGAIVTLGLFVLTNTKRLADAISIIHLPHDVGEFLTSMSETPILISYGALAIGVICVAYIVVSHWWAPKTEASKATFPSQLVKTPLAALPDPGWLRDVSLAGALWRAFQGHWMNVEPPQSELEKRKFEHTADQIRQHAFDSTLPVWGRRRGSNLFQSIPREFWINHAIQPSYSSVSKR